MKIKYMYMRILKKIFVTLGKPNNLIPRLKRHNIPRKHLRKARASSSIEIITARSTRALQLISLYVR